MTTQEKTSQVNLLENLENKDNSIIFTSLVKRRRVLKEGRAIREPSDVVPFIKFIKNKKQEHFLCITLNGSHEIIAIRTVTVGLVNSCSIHPREVFADAISDRAVSIIVAHNHPSGSLELSKADIEVTERLEKVGLLVGINLLDHIVISKKGFRSVKQDCVAREFKK